DRLDRLERLEHIRQVQAEFEALPVPSGRLAHLARAEPEAQPPGDRERPEPALQAHGVVVGRDEGVERFLLLGHRAARFDVGTEQRGGQGAGSARSEEHTSELQSPYDLVCRLLLEKKKYNNILHLNTYSHLYHSSISYRH